MKIPSVTREYGLRFNLTPMIDIVFLLIIFFLIASYLSSSENQETVQLASATASQPDINQMPHRIVVTITAQGDFLVGGKSISLTEFASLIRSADSGSPTNRFDVRIRADKRVTYEKVEPLLVECAKANVTQLKFNVIPSTGK